MVNAGFLTIVCIMSLLIIMPAQAKALDFTVRLVINNTQGSVYIPGTGEIDSGSIGDIPPIYNPLHFYLASYFSNVLQGLAASGGVYINASSDTSSHAIEITQGLQKSRIFLVFTKGDYNNIEKNIGLIESGDFLAKISPSFAYGLGSLFPIKIALEYPDIDIQDDLKLRRGTYRLLISYVDFSEGRPVISIKIV